MTSAGKSYSCIILAGGEGKRVGGVDKGLLEYRDSPLIEHVINTVSFQVDDIVISANRNTERYKKYGYKIITDASEQYRGPMAGISAALAHCHHDWVLVVACDTPFLPPDIIERFLSYGSSTQLYIACSNDKLQLVMLLHKSLHESINNALDAGQLRLMQWSGSHNPVIVDFKDDAAFRNLNNPEDFSS